MSHRKRKYRQRSDTYSNQYDPPVTSSSTPTDHSLFIVAHEVDIIRGPQAASAADSLEVGINVDGRGGSRIGDGLIKWESKAGSNAESGDIWVDRYVISLRDEYTVLCALCVLLLWRGIETTRCNGLLYACMHVR